MYIFVVARKLVSFTLAHQRRSKTVALVNTSTSGGSAAFVFVSLDLCEHNCVSLSVGMWC